VDHRPGPGIVGGGARRHRAPGVDGAGSAGAAGAVRGTARGAGGGGGAAASALPPLYDWAVIVGGSVTLTMVLALAVIAAL
jgi:hypothetical protein